MVGGAFLPVGGGVSGYEDDVVLCLEGQFRIPCTPVGHGTRPGIIGRRRKPDIAEAVAQIGEEMC